MYIIICEVKTNKKLKILYLEDRKVITTTKIWT